MEQSSPVEGKVPQQYTKAEEELTVKQKQLDGEESLSKLSDLQKNQFPISESAQDNIMLSYSTSLMNNDQHIIFNAPSSISTSATMLPSNREDGFKSSYSSNNTFRGEREFPDLMPEQISSSQYSMRPGRPQLTTKAPSKNQKTHEWIYRQFKKHYDPEKRNKHQVTVEIANFTKWSTSTILNIVKKQEELEKNDQYHDSSMSQSPNYDQQQNFRNTSNNRHHHHFLQKSHSSSSNYNQTNNQNFKPHNNRKSFDQIYSYNDTHKPQFQFDDDDDDEIDENLGNYTHKMVKREFSQPETQEQSEEDQQLNNI